MISTLRDRSSQRSLAVWLIAVAVLALAFFAGQRASPLWLVLLAVGAGGVALFAQPTIGLLALVLAAIVAPIEFRAGNNIRLNLASLLTPALFVFWMLAMTRRRHQGLVHTRAMRPLLLFVAWSLLALLIGNATWDPFVPRPDGFLVVQLAQWAIFAFSAMAFLLTSNLIAGEAWLQRMTWVFLGVAGSLAILRALPDGIGIVDRLATGAIIRAPFWVLLAAMAGGQLLFNHKLSTGQRIFLAAIFAGILVYILVQAQEATSNWVGVGSVVAVLVWFRFPRLRLPMVVVLVLLTVLGVLVPSLYDFAGGEDEWNTSGGTRLALIERVVDVTMRNPVSGLGPAAYRPYAAMRPLPYRGAFWVTPQINSHNNYVDLFSQVGVAGLVILFWFVIEIGALGARLRTRYREGFAAGYLNGVLAAGVGALVIMAFADWILPFVYNIGFYGFQASILIWLFLGGLVVLEQQGIREGGLSISSRPSLTRDNVN